MKFDEIVEGGKLLRHMTESDIERVLLIEGASFDQPWTRANFADELKNPDLSLPLVLTESSVIIAFTVNWLIIDEWHLANIAVHPDFRKRGLGKYLMQKTIDLAMEKDCKKIMLEVRKSNVPAMGLYHTFGFVKVGVRKGYYHDGFMNSEDAILMDLLLPRPAKKDIISGE